MTEPITEPADLDEVTDGPQEAAESPQDAPETFPREYVEKLRAEAAESRLKAKKAEGYARALFTARVAATGRLADPNDMPFNIELLEDHAALDAAIDELLHARPHYAARTPHGDIGQGVTTTRDEVDLAALLRKGA